MTRRCRASAALPALVLAFALLGAGAPAVRAGDAPPAGSADDRPANSADVVQAALRPVGVSGRPGQAVAFAVEFTVRPGWHLYAHGDTVFYGIALAGFEQGPLARADVAYPDGKAGEFFGTPVRLLTGRQSITVRGVVADSCRAGVRTVPLSLEVQACDEQSCLAPARLALPLRLEVVPARRR